MARKRMEDKPALKSWADVDKALMEIAQQENALADIENEMDKQIQGIKMIADQEAKPHKDRISKLAKDIKEYVEEHRADLGNKKSRELTFGECGFRLSTKVELPKEKEALEALIQRLRTRKMADCLTSTVKVNKDALKQYGKEVVHAVGAVWKQKDVFWYDTNHETLDRLEQGEI